METTWTTRQQGERLTLIHDNRWLAVVGVPLALVGLTIAIGPWLIKSARQSDGWPILVVGSLIGFGFVTAGLAICLHYVELVADRDRGILRRITGRRPFQRIREWSLSDFTEIACEEVQMARASGAGGSPHQFICLKGSAGTVKLASDLDSEVIVFEASRWAEFLGLPIRNHLGNDKKSQIRRSLEERRASAH